MARLQPLARSGRATIDLDHHANGHEALTPIMLLTMLIVCGVAYFIFSQVQITSTEQTILSLLQVTTQLPPAMTVSQVQQFMAGQLDRYTTIADSIGWSVQIALLLLSFPVDSALLMVHRKYAQEASTSLAIGAARIAKWQTFCIRVLVGGDVLTDCYYVFQQHVTVAWNGLLPFVTGLNAGIVLVGVIYPVAVCFITVFAGKYTLIFLDALLEQFRSRRAQSAE